MKPFLIILSFFISTISFSQDTIQSDTKKNSTETTVQNKQKKKGKRKFLGTWIPADSNNNYKDNYLNYKSSSNRKNLFLIPLFLIACTALIIIVMKKLKANKTSGKEYGYFKNEDL